MPRKAQTEVIDKVETSENKKTTRKPSTTKEKKEPVKKDITKKTTTKKETEDTPKEKKEPVKKATKTTTKKTETKEKKESPIKSVIKKVVTGATSRKKKVEEPVEAGKNRDELLYEIKDRLRVDRDIVDNIMKEVCEIVPLLYEGSEKNSNHELVLKFRKSIINTDPKDFINTIVISLQHQFKEYDGKDIGEVLSIANANRTRFNVII